MFSSLLAVIGILSKIVDFGIEPIVFREFSKENDNFRIFNTALNLRFLIYFLLVAVFNFLAPLMPYTSREIIFCNILFTTIIFSMKTVNVRELLSTPFKVHLKMHYPMVLSILDNLLLLVMIFAIPFMKDGTMYFVFIYAVSNIPGFILSFYYLKRKFGFRYRPTFDRGIWLLKESFPLFGFVLLTTIFVQIDIIILSFYKGSFDTGIYSAGTRLTMPLNIIPGAIVTTVFPILIKRISDKAGSESLSNLVVKFLFFISFIIAAVFTFEAGSLVTLIFGADYSAAGMPALILFWCQVFLFFNYYTLVVLIAQNKQFYNFLYGAIQVVVNLAANFILIPRYSYTGASVAKLLASFVSFLFILIVLNRSGYRPSIGRYRVLIWTVLICSGLYLLSFMPLIPYLLLAGPLIFAVTIGSGFFNNDELIVFFRLLNREELGRVFIEKCRLG